ncbi:MAG: hypothetical protein WCZ20_02450 [Hydrogenophaga sp.]
MADTPTQTRASRDLSTRERVERPKAWRPPETLPMPDPRPGWTHRWIRVSMMGDADPSNVSSKLREGWEPVKAADYPELKVYGPTNAHFPDGVEVGGLLLCRIPEEFMKQREDYYNGQNRQQMESVDKTFMRENDARMPLFSERKTDVTFGNGT